MAEWGDSLTGILFIMAGIYLVCCGFGILGKKRDAARSSEKERRLCRWVEKMGGIGCIIAGIGFLI